MKAENRVMHQWPDHFSLAHWAVAENNKCAHEFLGSISCFHVTPCTAAAPYIRPAPLLSLVLGLVSWPANWLEFTWFTLHVAGPSVLQDLYFQVKSPGPWFNIKMSSYQYRKSHCGDKTIFRPSYLHNGIPILVRWYLYIESGPRSPNLQPGLW